MRFAALMLAAVVASGCSEFALAAQLIKQIESNNKKLEQLKQEQKQIETNIGLAGGVLKTSPSPSPSP